MPGNPPRRYRTDSRRRLCIGLQLSGLHVRRGRTAWALRAGQSESALVAARQGPALLKINLIWDGISRGAGTIWCRVHGSYVQPLSCADSPSGSPKVTGKYRLEL